MQFVSKNINLRIVLRPSIEANRLTGMPAQSGISVRFEDGLASVENPDWVALMLAHPAYGRSYTAIKDGDDSDSLRRQSEPAHDIMSIEHGSMVKRTLSAPDTSALEKKFISMAEQLAATKVEAAARENEARMAAAEAAYEEKLRVYKAALEKEYGPERLAAIDAANEAEDRLAEITRAEVRQENAAARAAADAQKPTKKK